MRALPDDTRLWAALQFCLWWHMGWLRLRCRRDPQCTEIDACSSEVCRFSKLAMRNLKYWAPPLLYMVLVFVVSSLEQPPLPMPEFEWLTIDKLYHFIEYAILSGLVARALVKAKPPVVPHDWVCMWRRYSLFSMVRATNGTRPLFPADLLPWQIGLQMYWDQLLVC